MDTATWVWASSAHHAATLAPPLSKSYSMVSSPPGWGPYRASAPAGDQTARLSSRPYTLPATRRKGPLFAWAMVKVSSVPLSSGAGRALAQNSSAPRMHRAK